MCWLGGAVVHENLGCIGNVLADADVLDAMARSMADSVSEPRLAQRFVAALQAGADTGGDARGQQAAGVLVVRSGGGYGGHTDRLVDLRVDDHVRPIAELNRLLDLQELHFGRSDQSVLLPLAGTLADEVVGLLAGVGFRSEGDSIEGVWTELSEWGNRANLDQRLAHPLMIDPVVLEMLREQSL